MTALRLESFDSGTPGAAAPEPHASGDGFDEGYKAGWEDAVHRLSEENARIADDLAERLAAIRRTRDEVEEDVLRALSPLLHEVFDKLLPRGARRAFVPLVVAEARQLARDAAGLAILVAPEDAGAVEALVARTPALANAVTIRPEPALPLSQALLQWQGGERRIDLDAALSELDAALDAFLASDVPRSDVPQSDSRTQEAAHG